MMAAVHTITPDSVKYPDMSADPPSSVDWSQARARNPEIDVLVSQLFSHPELKTFPEIQIYVEMLVNDEWTTGAAGEKNYTGYIAGVLMFTAAVGDVNGNIAKGDTVLQWVCRKPWHIRHLLVNVLVLLGADVNSANELGVTALHMACAEEDDGSIEALLQAGASVTIRDTYGATPLDYALWRGYNMNLSAKEEMESGNSGGVGYNDLALVLDEKVDIEFDDPDEIVQWVRDYVKEGRSSSRYDEVIMELEEKSKNEHEASDGGEILEQALSLFSIISDDLKSKDLRLGFTTHVAGSTAEGTACKASDLDFVLDISCLKDVSELDVNDSFPAGYAAMKRRPSTAADFDPFFTGNHLDVSKFLKVFVSSFKDSFLSVQNWHGHGTVRNIVPDLFYLNDSGDIDCIYVWWFGQHSRALRIKIDVVPAIYYAGYWPADSPAVNPLGKDIQKEVFVIMKLIKEYALERYGRRDMKHSLLSVSQHKAEHITMRALPANIKRAYVLTKILVEDLPFIKGEKDIFSYMLKTAVFHLVRQHSSNTADDPASQQPPPDQEQTDKGNVICWIMRIVNFIETSIVAECIPEYFEPRRNLLQNVLRYPDGFEKDTFYPVLPTLKAHCLMLRCVVAGEDTEENIETLDRHLHTIYD